MVAGACGARHSRKSVPLNRKARSSGPVQRIRQWNGCPCGGVSTPAAVRANTCCPTIRRPQELCMPGAHEPGRARDFSLTDRTGKRQRTVPALRSSAASKVGASMAAGRRRLSRTWLMKIAARMSAAPACRNSNRNCRVSCHLEQRLRRGRRDLPSRPRRRWEADAGLPTWLHVQPVAL